jgi:hypothetical protein
VVLSSPPSFPGEPKDLADRAWFAGPGYRDIAPLFAQAGERLTPDGRFYLLLSSDSELGLLGNLTRAAGFTTRLVAERSIGFESFILYELRLQRAGGSLKRGSTSRRSAARIRRSEDLLQAARLTA